MRHHNHETDSYVNDMSKSYFIDKLAEDEKIKYVVDCFQERPLANVKITGLTLSCDATKGSGHWVPVSDELQLRIAGLSKALVRIMMPYS